MLGAIVGDIVGSVYEWNNIKTKDFPLFREDCFFTDDTVMTCAVSEAEIHSAGHGHEINGWKPNSSRCILHRRQEWYTKTAIAAYEDCLTVGGSVCGLIYLREV